MVAQDLSMLQVTLKSICLNTQPELIGLDIFEDTLPIVRIRPRVATRFIFQARACPVSSKRFTSSIFLKISR